jgi:hypothetical protein
MAFCAGAAGPQCVLERLRCTTGSMAIILIPESAGAHRWAAVSEADRNAVHVRKSTDRRTQNRVNDRSAARATLELRVREHVFDRVVAAVHVGAAEVNLGDDDPGAIVWPLKGRAEAPGLLEPTHLLLSRQRRLLGLPARHRRRKGYTVG